MNFTVWIVTPEGDIHWQGLFEAAQGIRGSLVILGYVANLIAQPEAPAVAGRLIIFNGHRLPAGVKLPDGTIFYNAEQMSASWVSLSAYLGYLQRHQVWDYSEENLKRLRQLGVAHAILCPLGYFPANEIPVATETIDVVFFGSINERRARLFDAIRKQDLSVVPLFGVYGADRDHYIAQAKLVLNVHYYPEPIFEIFRVARLLANHKCVVSEDGGVDPTLETLAATTTAYAPIDQIPALCKSLVKDPGRRKDIAARGFAVFSELNQVEFVRLALEAS